MCPWSGTLLHSFCPRGLTYPLVNEYRRWSQESGAPPHRVAPAPWSSDRERLASGHGSSKPAASSCRQLLQQRLRLLQIERTKPLRKPPVNRRQQFTRLLRLALVAPEPGEAHGGAEFPGFGLLLTGDCEGALEVSLSFGCIRIRREQCDFAAASVDLSLPPRFLSCCHRGHCFANTAPSFIKFAEARIGCRQI